MSIYPPREDPNAAASRIAGHATAKLNISMADITADIAWSGQVRPRTFMAAAWSSHAR
jgi:hypothetical protein